MRFAILADIHANLAGFEAVLRDIAERGGVHEIWCLGDIVGYGPDPSACIALLRQQPHICVAGNHDWAAIGKLDVADFNPHAAAACQWTGAQLDREDVEYLEGLPKTRTRYDFTLVHGSPRDPIWEYVVSTGSAADNFRHFDTGYCLVGHSHVPAVFEEIDGTCKSKETPTTLRLGGNRFMLNPGSVGQPRDGDPRAAYVLIEIDEDGVTAEIHRVAYDVEAMAQAIEETELPAEFARAIREAL